MACGEFAASTLAKGLRGASVEFWHPTGMKGELSGSAGWSGGISGVGFVPPEPCGNARGSRCGSFRRETRSRVCAEAPSGGRAAGATEQLRRSQHEPRPGDSDAGHMG